MYNNSLSKEKMGIDYVINPEKATAEEIIRLLKTPSNVCEAHVLANGKISLFGLRIEENSHFVNKKIRDTNLRHNTLLITIFRENNLLIPTDHDKIYTGDMLYLLVKKTNFADSALLYDKKTLVLQNALILGGSSIGIQTAALLNKMGIKTKIIEIDKQKCETISELLPQTMVINGDGTNIDLLKEEGIEKTDGFVALTGFDEENLLVALLAKHLGTKKVISKISKINYIPILEKIGIDAVVNPRLTTASAILHFLKQGEFITLTLLKEGEIEVVELMAQKDSKINGKPLRAVDMPVNAIIGVIIRNDKIIIPRGEDFVTAGDKVIIFTKTTDIKKIEQLFYKMGK